MFEEMHFDDFCRGLPYYLLLILLICSAANGSRDTFQVHRMSQFDINGAMHGCRASALSLEAKSLFTWSTGRHCVVAKFQDITVDQFHEIRQKAGGLVVIMPKNISAEEKEQLTYLEQAMIAQPSSIPIYFSPFNSELEKIVSEITQTASIPQSRGGQAAKPQSSAFAELFASISANGYQIVVSGASHAANKNSKIPIIQGELAPSKPMKVSVGPDGSSTDINSKLPLIIVTAHLNTFGLYNEYPLNADVAVLMSIADTFSKIHSMPSMAPKFRLMFLLSESGPLLNFQGLKKWLDENVQLQNVDFVFCLDTIAQPLLSADSNALYMHVSKPPKEGTPMSHFYKLLKTAAAQHGNITVDGVHKKINLAEQQLAWEHERFSMRRLPAFTLSTLKSPKEPVRTTIFREADAQAQLLAQTQRNAEVVTEALARYVYNIAEDTEIISGTIQINKNLIKSYLNMKSALHNNDLRNGFEKYLKNVKLMYDKPDAREPDFLLYEGQEASLSIYRVKPAVFDLFLTTLICAYLASVYLAIQYFPVFYTIVCRMTKTGHTNYHIDRQKAKIN